MTIPESVKAAIEIDAEDAAARLLRRGAASPSSAATPGRRRWPI